MQQKDGYLNMRVYINQRRINRNRRLAQVLGFVSIGILLGTMALVSGFIPITNPILYAAPLILMPTLLITLMYAIWLTNYYGRTPYAEDVLRDGLKGVDKRSILYQYLLPSDHVLVTLRGIYALTTRFQETRFKIEGSQWTDYKARDL